MTRLSSEDRQRNSRSHFAAGLRHLRQMRSFCEMAQEDEVDSRIVLGAVQEFRLAAGGGCVIEDLGRELFAGFDEYLVERVVRIATDLDRK